MQALTQLSQYVIYVPESDGFGTPFDTFGYTMGFPSLSLTSSEASVSLAIEADNDLPQVFSRTYSFVEDSLPNGLLIELNASDAEVGTPLDILISSLPSLGTLYQTSDGTLAGSRTPITSAYNIFEVGVITSQYVERVLAVSSFWGTPPSPDYHPL